MEEQLREIIARVAETDDLDFDVDAELRERLDIDSHRIIDMVFEIESTFDVMIPPERVEELATLRSSMALLQSLQGVG